jgi:hypothetical protein
VQREASIKKSLVGVKQKINTGSAAGYSAKGTKKGGMVPPPFPVMQGRGTTPSPTQYRYLIGTLGK